MNLAKMSNFFQQTTMSRRLGPPLGKKLQKVPDFAKKHRKSSICPKLATFWSKPPRFAVWVNVSAKSCKKGSILPKSMKKRRFGQNLQLSRANHDVSAFGSTFKQKVAKSASFGEKHEKSSIWPKCSTF